MASSYLQQTNNNNFLTPFTISDDCPLENRETIHKILIASSKKQNFYNKSVFMETI